LRECGGQILFLGCGLRPNTSMHGVEELVEPPYLFGTTVTYRARLAGGDTVVLRCRRHNFAGYEQRYDRLANLLAANELRAGHILGAAVHLVEAGPMWARAEAALQANPLHFVDRAA
jgi:aminoglycoside 3-N-acetyltransferase